MWNYYREKDMKKFSICNKFIIYGMVWSSSYKYSKEFKNVNVWKYNLNDVVWISINWNRKWRLWLDYFKDEINKCINDWCIRFVIDNKFDRAALNIKTGEGEEVAQMVENYITSIDTKERNPKATFHENYVRNGTIFEEGENGILLNNDAVAVLIDETLKKLSELSIRQAKSYMYVDEILVDYNDSNRMMRIKQDESLISSQPNSPFTTYFYAKDK